MDKLISGAEAITVVTVLILLIMRGIHWLLNR